MLTFFVIIIVGPNIQEAFGHKYDFEDEIQDDLLLLCEVHYEDYAELGLVKYLERHVHDIGIKHCVELYNHPIWITDHPARNRVLSSILEQLVGETAPEVKQRHIPTAPGAIPEWVKNDARIWSNDEHTDSRFAFSIRYMINSNIVVAPTFPSTETIGCEDNQMCVRTGDYVKYSMKDNFGKDVITVKDVFYEIVGDKIKIISEKTSKEGRVSTEFLVNLSNGVTDLTNEISGKCCSPYQFIYPEPLKIGDKINTPKYNLTVVAGLLVPYEGRDRTVLYAKDEAEEYIEVIDKETGLVLLKRFEIIDDILRWETTELTDTNIFQKTAVIQFTELSIPGWWKNNVKWWLAGEISDIEYTTAMEYLWGKNILRI